MAYESNSVFFTSDGRPYRPQEPKKLPALVEQLKERAISQLHSLLVEMLDNADDALFDLADKAHSNKDQSMYFDSMRELRIKRKGIENLFRQELNNAFRLLAAPGEGAKPDVVSFSLDNIALVKEDELEENLAVEGMVKKARARNEEAIRHLLLRVSSLMPGQISDSNNPLDPQPIGEAFRNALRSLDLDIKATLIIYKLFDRYTLNNLDEVYADLNAFLAENGVLPDIKAHRIQRAHGSRAPAKPKPEMPVDDGLGDTVEASRDEREDEFREMFGMLRELLAQQKLPAGSGMPAGNPAYSGASLNPAMYGSIPLAPVAATNEVLQALSSLQSQSSQYPTAVGTEPQPLAMVDLRAALATQLPAVAGGARNVAQMDQDVIDIVSMLFEFILDDRNLPDDIKALLSRLQIPMLKVGLLDKAFFSKRQHPARKLLNELAQAAIGWDPGRRAGKDGLHAKIESIVNRVLTEFESDLNLFSVLLAEFERYVEDENKRVSLIEKRTREAEEGKAKADSARSQVNAVLNPLLADKACPEVVRGILNNAWSNVLFLIALREGTEGEMWRHHVQTARDLLWSVAPKRNDEERRTLRARMPGLVEELKAGLSTIAYSQFETAKFFQDLEEAHLRAFRDEPVPVAKPVEPPLLVEEVRESLPLDNADDVDLSGFDNVDLEPDFGATDILSEDLGNFSREDAALLAQVNIAPAADVAADTMAAEVSPGTPAVTAAPAKPATPEPELVAKVDAMPLGAWIEVSHGDGDRAIRCKLVAKIPSTGKLIFVNRTGIKVADYTINGLALALAQGEARLLDDAALFDRALEAVISNLRKLKSE